VTFKSSKFNTGLSNSWAQGRIWPPAYIYVAMERHKATISYHTIHELEGKIPYLLFLHMLKSMQSAVTIGT